LPWVRQKYCGPKCSQMAFEYAPSAIQWLLWTEAAIKEY
jgi:hypothetical protein